MHCCAYASETKIVRDYERINGIVLRKVRMRILEFFNLLRIEDVDFSVKLYERTVLSQKVDKVVAINRG